MSELQTAELTPSDRFEILLCDDNERHRAIYEQAITAHLPAVVLFASNGTEAMAAMQSTHPPDLVVLDLEMPSIDGEEVLTRIKSDHRLRFTPVIILTGHGGLERQMELLDKGADDFIEKGSTPEILIARLRAQMRHKLAVDRLERTALDRDVFAAGVLEDIGSVKNAIVHLCQAARVRLELDPVEKRDEILGDIEKLASHAAKLGQYASGVIQSVRDTHRTAVVAPQDPGALIAWVHDLVTVGGGEAAKLLQWSVQTDMKAMLADKNFLRMALLNVVQHVLEGVSEHVVVLTVSQEIYEDRTDPMNRQHAILHIHDSNAQADDEELERLFRPYTRDADDASFHLGLSLVAKVMTKMGGRVHAKNATGGGVVYALDLPLAPLA